MHIAQYAMIALAALLGGAVNALAGGGTLITFPALTAAGISPLAASVTNTVALCPGYLGATLAQAGDLKGQGRRLRLYLPAGALGGVAGGLLLLHSGERLFAQLVPFLILLAALLLALQPHLRAWLERRARQAGVSAAQEGWAALPLALAAVYGGYFGAGLSVIVLAALGMLVSDNLTRLNALKQAIALAVNVAAAVFFLFSARVAWSAALLMALFALLGGALGGRLAGRIAPDTLRRVVVVIGALVAVAYWLR